MEKKEFDCGRDMCTERGYCEADILGEMVMAHYKATIDKHPEEEVTQAIVTDLIDEILGSK